MSAATLERFKNKDLGVVAGPKGQTSVISSAFVPLVVLFGVTGIVLLSACANIANLLLARATRRAGEMAVRLSIGASRRHLISQLLTESVLLASLGGFAGLLVARWTLAAIQRLLPAEQSAMMSFSLDPGMVLFLAGVTLGTGLLFGLFPALHSSRPNLAMTLKGTAGQPAGARSAKRRPPAGPRTCGARPRGASTSSVSRATSSWPISPATPPSCRESRRSTGST